MADAVATLVVRMVADVKDAQKGLDDTASRADKMKASIGTAGKVAGGVLLAMGAAAISFGNAAAEDAQSAALLKNALVNTTGATEKQVAAVEDYIAAMSAASGVADDQLRPAMATLARATGSTAKSQEALQVALDVAAATGSDVESVSKALAKGYAGQTTSIGKLVPGMDKAVLAGGDMTAIMDELAKKTGGAAAAAADTTAGKMQKMQVSMDEAKESLGAALLPAMSKFADVAAKVAGAIQAHPGLFTAVAAAIAIMATAIIALNIAVGIYTAVTTLAGSVTVMAWVAALWPILAVIAAVALVVGAVVLLWKNSETFRDIVLGVWSAVKGAIQATFSWIKSNWPLILAILTGPIGIAVALIIKNWEKIKSTADTVFSAVKTAVGWVSTAVDTLIGWLGKIKIPDMSGPFDTAKTAVGKVSGALDTMIGWLADIVIPSGMAGPFDTLKAAVDGVIGKVESLIGWLKKIKVPSIHIPGTGGGKSAPAPAVAVAGYAAPRVSLPSTRATGAGGGVTINVTGAIDPEATARQIRRILAGHDRRVGLAT